MPTVKSNENEFKSQVNSWVNEFLNTGTYPFDLASSDRSVKVSEKKARFPDVNLFQEFFKRTFDHKLSETLTQKTLIDLGLPERKI